MQVRPLYDRVLVKRLESETKSTGGLFLPESAKEKPFEGMVLAVGQGRLTDSGELRPLSVKVDDKVMFRKFGGNEIKVDGEELIVLREDDILGVIG
jgi:chaperonin GroES